MIAAALQTREPLVTKKARLRRCLKQITQAPAIFAGFVELTWQAFPERHFNYGCAHEGDLGIERNRTARV
jgi:hypothetical protein